MSQRDEDLTSAAGQRSIGMGLSGETLEALLRHFECGIVYCGQEGEILGVAGAVRLLLGRDSDLVGMNLRDMISPEHHEMANEILDSGRKSEPHFIRRVGFLGMDGSPRELSVLAVGESRFPASAAVSLILSRPVREGLKFAAEGMHLSMEDRLRAIADYGYDWEVLFDAEGKVMWVNPAVERITGYTPSECFSMEGFPLSLVEGSDYERMRRYFSGAVQGTTGNDVEFRVRRKDGSLVWVAVSWQPIVGEEGVLQGHRGSIRDISLRKGAERDLRENRRQLRTLLSNLPGMAYRCPNTIDWPMQFVSEGCRALTGYDPDDLTSGRVPYGELIHPEDRQKVWLGVQEGVTNERPFQIEYRIVDRAGHEHWVWEQGQMVRGAEGEEALEGFITDITGRVKSEQALRRSEEQFRALIEQSLQGLVILQGEDARIVFANPVVAQVIGYSLAELLTSTFTKLLTPESAHLLVRYHTRLRGGAEPARYEASFRRQDGSVIWADVAAARIIFHGAPAVQLVMLDITARKQAELELRRRDAILQALGLVAERLLQVPDLRESMRSSLGLLGIATQVDRICIYGSDSDRSEWLKCECMWCSAEGRSQSEADSQTGYCDLRRDDAGMTTFLAALAAGQPMQGVSEQAPEALRSLLLREGMRSLCVVPIFAHRAFWGFVAFHSRDAHRTWSEAEIDAVHAVAGTLGAAVERNETRRALQKSEAYWRTLVTNLPNIVFILDLQGYLTFINRPNHPDKALQAVDPIGRLLYEYIRPEERERAREKIDRVMRTGESVTWEVLESGGVGDPAGQWFTVTASPVRDNGAIIGVVGVMTNITEQKHAAEELLRSERRFRQIVEGSPMGIHLYRLEHDGRLVLEGANSAADRILGIRHDSLFGKTIEEAFPPLAATDVPEQYRRAAEAAQVWETEQVTYEDERIRGAFQVVAFQVSQGRMAAMFLDVTERKRMMSALAESEERFRKAFQTSPDAIALTRIEDGVYVDVNQGFTAITGYSRDDLIGKGSLDLGIWVDPADREFMIRELRQHGHVVNLELEFRRKDGSVLVGLMSASTLLLEGKPYVLTIVRDIQELKETREALRKEMVKAQRYLDVAATIMLALDRTWRIRMINRKGADLLGIPEEELIGRAWIDEFVPEEDRGMNRATLEKYLAGEFEGMDYYESWVAVPGGERRLIAWYLTTIRDSKGSVESILTSGIDITDRRRMEDELLRTHEQLEAEHEALLKKNIALREVLNQIEGEKEGIKRLVVDNIESDILPTLQRLRAMGGKPQEALFEVLEDGLEQISSEFASGLKERFKNLTPRQLQICRMIKNGYTSKDIAESLGTSLLTVHKHREAIRDKLGLKNRNVNLNSYLQSL